MLLLGVVEIALFAPLVLGLTLPLITAYGQRESFDFVFVAATFVGHVSYIISYLVYYNITFEFRNYN